MVTDFAGKTALITGAGRGIGRAVALGLADTGAEPILQDQYEDFDRRTLTIKGWIGAGAFAALAVSFSISSKYAYIAPLLVAILACVFWYLEAHWKLFQEAMADRIRIIEAYFREDEEVFVKNPVPFQAFHQFYLSYGRDKPIYEYYRPR